MIVALALLLTADADYETVITGTRTPRTIGDSAVATDVIKKSDVERSGAENLSGVLEDYAGVDVPRNFSGAGVRIQGLDSQYVLILVDGERLNGRVNGTIDLNRLSADDIERIELVRGPASALYGSDALGGVINIITKKARRPIEAEAHGRYGFGTPSDPLHAVDLSGKVASVAGRFNLKLTGGYHRISAFDLDKSDRATTGNTLWQMNFSGRAAYTIAERKELVLRTEYTRRDQQGIDVAGSGAVLARFNATETFAVSLSPIIALTDTGELRATVSYTFFRDQFLRDQANEPVPEYQENIQGLGQLQFVYAQRFGDAHTVSIGGEGLIENNKSQRLSLSGGTAGRVRSGVYVQDEWTITREPKIMLVPGIRLDGDSQFGAQPSPKIALRIDPFDGLTLRASYGWGFRAPSFQELYLMFNNSSVGYTVQGNPRLRPELSQAMNAGAEYTPASWIMLALNFYRNDLENLIAPTSQSPGDIISGTVFGYANISRARTQGFESRVQLRPLPGLIVDLGYTLLDAQDLERKRRLDGRAAHRFNFGASYAHEAVGFNAMFRGSVVGDRPYYLDLDLAGTAAPVIGPTYLSLDARVAQRIGGHVEVFVGVDNIANAGDARFLPLVPRMAYAGLTGRY